MVKAIILSSSEILINSGKAWEYLIRSTKISKDKLKEIDKKYIETARVGKYNKTQLISILSKELNLTKKQVIKLFTTGSKKLYVNKKTIKLIPKLKKKYKLALVANSTAFFSSLSVEKRIYKLIKPTLLSYKVKAKLGSAKMLKVTLKKLKLKPKDCLYLDYRVDRLNVAKKLGLQTLLYKNTKQIEKLTQ